MALCYSRFGTRKCSINAGLPFGSAPQYLSELLQPVAKLESRQRLRSPSTSQLVVPCTRRSTIGDRAFSVAAPRAWNSLPDSLHKLSSFVNFKKHLKFDLFANSPVQHDIWREALLRQLVLLTVLYKLSALLTYLITWGHLKHAQNNVLHICALSTTSLQL